MNIEPVDNIELSQYGSRGGLFSEPASFEVSFRVIRTGQYWCDTFSIRDRYGNISEFGRRMGVKCKDKISLCSTRGKAVSEYLHRLAWKYARSLTPKGADVKDKTVYARAQRESPLEVSA